jgi:hypothetical protein
MRRIKPRRRREAAAPKHLVRAEPRLGVFPVGVWYKSWVRTERRRRPLPDVTEKLAAAAAPRALRVRSDNCGRVTFQVRPLGRWAIAAPGRRRLWNSRAIARRELPLGFGRKPAAHEATEGFRLVPVHVNDRLLGRKRPPSIKPVRAPNALALVPIARRRERIPPRPTLIAPPFAPVVAARIDEVSELTVSDRFASEEKRTQLDFVRPLFVIEHEASAGRSTQQKNTAGELGVAARRRGGRVYRNRDQRGRRIAERLARVMKRLRVHVLVAGSKLREVEQPVVVGSFRKEVLQLMQHGVKIAASSFKGQERQLPAHIVRDRGRVVQRVGRVDHARPASAVGPLAQTPIFLKPREVSELPEDGVDDRELRTQQSFSVEIVGKREDARSRRF